MSPFDRPSASRVVLAKIGQESDLLLRNLFEHYVYEMAVWFEIDTQPDGSYSYDTSPIWENGWDVYVARLGDSIAGFAIVAPAGEWLAQAGGRDVREFFVIRRFRRSGLGQEMASAIWSQYPGEWLVRVVEVNEPAVHFWRTAISRFSQGSFTEEVRIVNGRSWRFFRFISNTT
jgi:predicted acetyltransferase